MKRWRFLLLILSCCISTSLLANSGQLLPWSSENDVIYQGKIFEAKLVIDDSGSITPQDFNNLDHEHFSELFYYLENNVITEKEYKLRLILKKNGDLNIPTVFFIGNKKIDLKLVGFRIVEKKDLPKDYIIQTQNLSWKYWFSSELLWIVIPVFTLVFVGFCFFIRKIILKNKARREMLLKKDFWKSYFYSAQSRQEFEDIGKRRAEWLKLLKEHPESCSKFFTILEEHQYKKEITDSELKEIKQALNGMKDVIERFGI